jgi:hypothetical protein
MVAGTVLVARAPMFVKLTLQPVGDHHLPKLHVTVGPSLDDEIRLPEQAAPDVAPAPVPADHSATTGPIRAVAPAEPPARPPRGDAGRPAGKDQTASAVVHTLRGVSPDAVYPGIQGTGIRELTLAGVRIRRSRGFLAAHRRPGHPKLRVPKVPQPPAAQLPIRY